MQSRFGGDDGIIGRVMQINNISFTVVGVAPPSFLGVNVIFGPDLWVPSTMAEQLLPVDMKDALADRAKPVFRGVGRLKTGVTATQAGANLSTIAASLESEYPEANAGRTVASRPIIEMLFSGTPVVFAGIALLVVALVVLLVACSNVANLLMARAAARQQEIATRFALGANRARLVRQLLTESLVLGLLSGVAGCLLGYYGAEALWSFRPPEVTANLITPKFDSAVLAYTLLVSLLTGIVFGTLPALRATHSEISVALKEYSRTAGRSHSGITFSNVLLSGQVAFSVGVLVAASLFVRSIEHAYRLDPGFDAHNFAVFMTNPGQAGYSAVQTKAFYKNVRERVTTIPGVEAASWASNLPLWSGAVSGLQVEGREARSRTDAVRAVATTVDEGYFRTIGISLLEGRDFSGMDRDISMPVAIVNEKLARDFWPNQPVLGKHVQLPGDVRRQIVGVVQTANYSELGERPQAAVYVPLEQKYSDAMVLYVRSADPEQIMGPVQQEVRSTGPELWVNDVRTGRTIVEQALVTAKLSVTLLSVFGFLALALASVGLYGSLAFAVNRRRREIGVRMALGADQRSVMRLVMRQGMAVVSIGLVLGLVLAVMVSRMVAHLLYGVSANDPASWFAAILVLFTVAVAACFIPARAASRVDPLVTLRDV